MGANFLLRHLFADVHELHSQGDGSGLVAIVPGTYRDGVKTTLPQGERGVLRQNTPAEGGSGKVARIFKNR